MSRASEREAARKAAEILARATKRGDTAYDGEYGQGKLTKAQRESQKRHIPMTERDNSRSAKVKRALWG
jgi:hypothetical protein